MFVAYAAYYDETVKFIRTIDKIFDFFISRPFHLVKGIKNQSILTKQSLEKSILPLVQYLFTLTDQNDKFCMQVKKIFVIGQTIAVFAVAKKLLSNNKCLKNILTYCFSQDHIEL